MHWRLAFITSTLIIGTIIALTLAYLGWTRRRSTGANAFILMMLAIAVWSISYALELYTPLLTEKIFWHKMAYLGIPFVPLFWFIFNAQILSFQFAKNAKWLAGLSVIPVVTTVLTVSLEHHGYIWGHFELHYFSSLPYLHIVRLNDFYLFVGYSYLLLLIGTLLFDDP